MFITHASVLFNSQHDYTFIKFSVHFSKVLFTSQSSLINFLNILKGSVHLYVCVCVCILLDSVHISQIAWTL